MHIYLRLMLKILESFFENKARIKIERFKQLPSLHYAYEKGNKE
ncbi:hypothetical protein [Rickettsia montanensis]|nr:hypothetical protein [Rickettsia montanensis]